MRRPGGVRRGRTSASFRLSSDPAGSGNYSGNGHRVPWAGTQHPADFVPAGGEIRTLAADSSSRTSVQLARVILERKFGASPDHSAPAGSGGDAADCRRRPVDWRPGAAHRPRAAALHVYDLGAEWVEMTGLPMVFAVWAGSAGSVTPDWREAFADSCRFGREHMEEIVARNGSAPGFAPELVREYLTRHIVHELGAREYEGMELFLQLCARVLWPVGCHTRFDRGHSPYRKDYTGKTTMYILLLIVHVIVCLFLIVVVLLQSGKAADLAGLLAAWVRRRRLARAARRRCFRRRPRFRRLSLW